MVTPERLRYNFSRPTPSWLGGSIRVACASVRRALLAPGHRRARAGRWIAGRDTHAAAASRSGCSCSTACSCARRSSATTRGPSCSARATCCAPGTTRDTEVLLPRSRRVERADHGARWRSSTRRWRSAPRSGRRSSPRSWSAPRAAPSGSWSCRRSPTSRASTTACWRCCGAWPSAGAASCPAACSSRCGCRTGRSPAMVGARRPSVTTALGQLMARGEIERRPDGGWILRGSRREPRDPAAPSPARSDPGALRSLSAPSVRSARPSGGASSRPAGRSASEPRRTRARLRRPARPRSSPRGLLEVVGAADGQGALQPAAVEVEDRELAVVERAAHDLRSHSCAGPTYSSDAQSARSDQK